MRRGNDKDEGKVSKVLAKGPTKTFQNNHSANKDEH
jgi:hypothetical protein